MKKLSAALVGATIVASVVSSIATPAMALGGCGPNGHRDRFGYCVFGGQREDWCLRTKGHPAVRMPNGTLRCF